MPLGRKIILILVAVTGAYLAVSYLVLSAVVHPTLAALEADNVDNDYQRIREVLQDEVDYTRRINLDWSPWDDTYAFVKGEHDAYLAENMAAQTLINLGIDVMLFYDVSGQLYYEAYIDPETQAVTVPPAELRSALSIPALTLGAQPAVDAGVVGLVKSPTGPMAVATYPILTNDENGPAAGSLLIGRSLGERRAAEIHQRTRVAFELTDRDQVEREVLAGESGERLAENSRQGRVLTRHEGGGIVTYQLIPDVKGDLSILLRVLTPGGVKAAGTRAIAVAMVFLVVAGALILAVMWMLLHRLVVHPVTRLTRHMDRIQESGDLTRRIDLRRGDEIGRLAGRFNALVADLEAAQASMAGARDRALAASRAKSEFLATMSHEIRTPMNGVLGMTELLLGTQLDEQQRRFAETVQESGESLLSLINDILDYSKIEAGKLEMESVDLDLRQVIEDLGALFAAPAHRKGLELVCTTNPPDMHTAYLGDPGRLRQVLTNLISNAVKFTDEGEVLITVHAVEQNEETSLLRFSVRDTGIGIAAQDQERVFDSFAQADGSTTRNYGGTGLGLAIARQLVGLMDGELEMSSEPGIGSEFWFTLPLPRRTAAPAKTEQAQSLIGLRVLVVDDNATNREILSRQLENWKMRCELVANAADALAVLERTHVGAAAFDLAILDMCMPGIDGLELAQRVTADPRFSHMRMIMLSSVGAAGTPEQRSLAGIGRYLMKPARQSVLLDAIASVMAGPQSRSEPDSSSAAAAPRAVVPLSGCRVLLAEDNEVNVRVTRAMLRGLGCEVTVAEHGLEAVEVAMRQCFDLVLMDCQMPRMDGFEATRRLRAREAANAGSDRLPIIAVTANAMTGDRERCLDAGMDDYLSKPFARDELLNIVLRTRRIRQAGVSAVADSDTGEDNHMAAAWQGLPVVDYHVLDTIREMQDEQEPELLRDVIAAFLQSSGELATRLEDAVIAEHAERVARTAHALKSSSANIGARRVSELAKDLEVAGRTNALHGAPDCVAQLLHELQALADTLQDEIQRRAA